MSRSRQATYIPLRETFTDVIWNTENLQASDKRCLHIYSHAHLSQTEPAQSQCHSKDKRQSHQKGDVRSNRYLRKVKNSFRFLSLKYGSLI